MVNNHMTVIRMDGELLKEMNTDTLRADQMSALFWPMEKNLSRGMLEKCVFCDTSRRPNALCMRKSN